jgi:hypothetical protein
MSSTAPNNNNNRRQTRPSATVPSPRSGGSSPIHVSQPVSSSPSMNPSAAPSRDRSQVTIRSISASHAGMSHVASHTRTVRKDSPPKTHIPPIGGLARTPPPGLPCREPTIGYIPTIGGLPRMLPQGITLQEPQTMILLNKPEEMDLNYWSGFLGRRQAAGEWATESPDAMEEHEVQAIATPQKLGMLPPMLGERPNLDFQPKQFATATHAQQSDIATQFIPLRASAVPQQEQWDQLSSDIRELKSSSQDTSDAIRLLVNEIHEDRRSKKSQLRSRSSRG